MGKGAKEPAPRDLGKEYQQTLTAQINAQPQILAAQQQYAPQYTALNTQLFGQALMGQMQLANQTAPQYQQQLWSEQGSNPLLARLQQQALTYAGSTGALDPYTQSQLNQGVNQQFAQRGIYGSNQNLLQNLLNTSSAVRQRQQQDLGLAQSLYGTLQTNPSLTNSLYGNAGQMVGQSSVNPESAYAADLYNTNYNAQMNAYLQSKNNQAGLLGGLIGAGGTLLGGMAMGSTGLFKK